MLSFTRGTGGRRLQALDTLETQQRTQRVELLPLAIHCQQKTPEAARGGGGAAWMHPQDQGRSRPSHRLWRAETNH